jgi:hypothetical protein
VIDLDIWHHALHEITGSMALHWCRATPDELRAWSAALAAVAAEMEITADTGQMPAPASTAPAVHIIATAELARAAAADMPEWLLDATE